MTDIEVTITQPVIEVKFESTLNTGGGGAVDSVNGQTGDVVLTTTDINEGTNQYFTESRVRSTVLTGLSLATNAVIAATDSALVAFGKLQAQITALSNSLANYVTLATDQTISALKTFSNGFTLTPQATPTYARGRVFFDDANDCLAFMDSISGRSVQVGYEVLMLARNNTGVQINNGQVVYINGSTGTNSTLALARANAESTSMIIGIATHNIAINTVGKIVVFGLANDLDTSAFTDGQEVFLSAATAGALTATPPVSPNYVVRVGVVERAHPTQGKILVHPDTALSNNNSLGTSQKVSATENAIKTYVDTGLGTKQNSLGFTPENVGNKSTTTTLGTSNTLYPTQNAVKTYVDTELNPLTDKNQYIDVIDEFIGYNNALVPGTAGRVDTALHSVIKPAGVDLTKVSDTNKVCVLRFRTTGNAIINSYILSSGWSLGQGDFSMEFVHSISALATVAKDYVMVMGFANAVTNAGITNGVYFLYNRSSYGATIQCVTISGGVSTVQAASNISASTWYKYKIEVNADGTSVNFYIDGVLQQTITTNIPTATTLSGFYGQQITSSSFNTAGFDLDYVWYKYNLTTPR